MTTSNTSSVQGSRWLLPFLLITKSSKLIKVFKSAKVLKPLVTVVSMFVSTIVYAIGLGWGFAAGLVGMLFVHEIGHLLAFKRKGMHVSAPLFIPMLGAMVFSKDLPKANRHDEAYVGIAGPVIGSYAVILAMIAVIVWPGTAPEVLVLTAWVGLILNLFNLIPLSPLDGGRVTQAVGPKFKKFGIAILLVVSLLIASPAMLLIWILCLTEIRMDTYIRAGLAVALWLMMAALFAVGSESMWVAIMDCIIGGLFVVLMIGIAVIKYRENDEGDPYNNILVQREDEREQLPKETRRTWLVGWAGLSLLLMAMMFILYPYLPAEAL